MSEEFPLHERLSVGPSFSYLTLALVNLPDSETKNELNLINHGGALNIIVLRRCLCG